MTGALIWFKRDLRVVDHAPIAMATRLYPGQPLQAVYIIEPSLWQQADAAPQHWAFIAECLHDLAEDLSACGGRLLVRVGEVVDVLQALRSELGFAHLLAHEETGNGLSYARDKAVRRWSKASGVRFLEWPQMGVKRRLVDRDDWHEEWERFMRSPQWDSPPARTAIGERDAGPTLPEGASFGLTGAVPPRRQRGGRRRAQQVLTDFLDARCAGYRGGISSPLSAPSACSRLSPYLAYGCLSVREVVQATRARIAALHGEPRPGPSSACEAGLTAFLSRLHWHCHFIQKLEDEPTLEWRNLHRGYDGLREDQHNARHFDALTSGRTGWPMVDACVAMLRETGWLNFRMRAMLVSVAAYPLWLHWRPVGLWLARQFLDYEPGIHWSQLQMQSGTTGMNTTRVYNPVKQARDHDPKGHFVRRWLPYMRKVPDAWLFEPWLMPASVQSRIGLTVGRDVPEPLVDLDEALRSSKARLHRLRARPEVRAAVQPLVQKHGSRAPRARRRPPTSGAARQLPLDL